jgi:hypothetical protein
MHARLDECVLTSRGSAWRALHLTLPQQSCAPLRPGNGESTVGDSGVSARGSAGTGGAPGVTILDVPRGDAEHVADGFDEGGDAGGVGHLHATSSLPLGVQSQITL